MEFMILDNQLTTFGTHLGQPLQALGLSLADDCEAYRPMLNQPTFKSLSVFKDSRPR